MGQNTVPAQSDPGSHPAVAISWPASSISSLMRSMTFWNSPSVSRSRMASSIGRNGIFVIGSPLFDPSRSPARRAREAEPLLTYSSGPRCAVASSSTQSSSVHDMPLRPGTFLVGPDL